MDLFRLGPKNLIYTSGTTEPLLQSQVEDVNQNFVLVFIFTFVLMTLLFIILYIFIIHGICQTEAKVSLQYENYCKQFYVIQPSIEFGCQPQTFVTMEEMNRNLQKLEDDHQLMIGEQEGSLMDGRYHRYQSLNFDKPE